MIDLDDWEKRDLDVVGRIDQADPIWGTQAIVYQTARGWVVSSDRSGTYRCRRDFNENMVDWPATSKARLTSWINDQNRSGEKFPEIRNHVLESAYDARPIPYSKQVERFYLMLQERGYRPGHPIIYGDSTADPEYLSSYLTMMRWIEATLDRELQGFIGALESDGQIFRDGGALYLTSKGLLKLEQIDLAGASNDQAFVAMWFGTEMDAAYEDGIAPGLADAGYRAFRIDRKEHANKIDDEIIAEIRRSRFLLADFTCGTLQVDSELVALPRGGVYYEAGFAQGLNMPVVWSVRADQIGLVHFDTRQYNHITWQNPEDLRKRIRDRVIATIGEFGSPDKAI
ncbi:hypothetical protein KCP91_12170 [Microvirga sp. SRT01]|jgi:hypothetical protein|uniref:Uncharacterized protein n=1 Tax=Sphingomonas longa TaxID=2778730 RepID=A0ABS2D857_9SPHN|nr:MULTISPECIES: hypothetical protein [Alphaproteobacteria]MBM6577129.1 hypothetical protein [Sphingomonas sp. BT552]MBR7710173.1 hypothetical protein [Microvirga sp. SRT01]